MTVNEAATVLEVSPGTVYMLCRAGKLSHHRIGLGRGVIRLDPADVAEFKASHRIEASEAPLVQPAPLTKPRAKPAIPDYLGEYRRARTEARRKREQARRR